MTKAEEMVVSESAAKVAEIRRWLRLLSRCLRGLSLGLRSDRHEGC